MSLANGRLQIHILKSGWRASLLQPRIVARPELRNLHVTVARIRFSLHKGRALTIWLPCKLPQQHDISLYPSYSNHHLPSTSSPLRPLCEHFFHRHSAPGEHRPTSPARYNIRRTYLDTRLSPTSPASSSTTFLETTQQSWHYHLELSLVTP